MNPGATISFGTIAVLVLVWAVFEIGLMRTLIIAVAGTMVGIIGTAAGVFGAILTAITTAAAAFGG